MNIILLILIYKIKFFERGQMLVYANSEINLPLKD